METDFLSKLYRSINVANFILEDDGHSVAEAANEFECSKRTIQRDLIFLADVAYDTYSLPPGTDITKKYLRALYKSAKATLADLASKHNAKNIVKYNESRKKSSQKSIS